MANTPINTTEVFDALEAWINQRPGLEFANYGNMASYRAELRDIAKDKKRAIKALDEARALEGKPELLADAFRAFSGRLQWSGECFDCTWKKSCGKACKGHLSYCTGQYWPTEYRKAAATVLEAYISAWRQAENNAAPRLFKYVTLADVKAANKAIGGHWFDRSNMSFFNTQFESGLLRGKYFITSDRYDETYPRRYTIRMATPDGTIDTVGEFEAYPSLKGAREAVRGL